MKIFFLATHSWREAEQLSPAGGPGRDRRLRSNDRRSRRALLAIDPFARHAVATTFDRERLVTGSRERSTAGR